MHRIFPFPLIHCYSALDVLQMQMQITSCAIFVFLSLSGVFHKSAGKVGKFFIYIGFPVTMYFVKEKQDAA